MKEEALEIFQKYSLGLPRLRGRKITGRVNVLFVDPRTDLKPGEIMSISYVLIARWTGIPKILSGL